MLDDKEAIQQLKRQRRHGEEIKGDDDLSPCDSGETPATVYPVHLDAEFDADTGRQSDPRQRTRASTTRHVP